MSFIFSTQFYLALSGIFGFVNANQSPIREQPEVLFFIPSNYDVVNVEKIK